MVYVAFLVVAVVLAEVMVAVDGPGGSFDGCVGSATTPAPAVGFPVWSRCNNKLSGDFCAILIDSLSLALLHMLSRSVHASKAS